MRIKLFFRHKPLDFRCCFDTLKCANINLGGETFEFIHDDKEEDIAFAYTAMRINESGTEGEEIE